MVDEVFTGKINWVKENDKNDPEFFKEKSNIKRQEADKRPDTTNMPDLESEESAAQDEQSAKGLKIFTPDQIFSRLPISLAQLKAGRNSEKLNRNQTTVFFVHIKKIDQNNI